MKFNYFHCNLQLTVNWALILKKVSVLIVTIITAGAGTNAVRCDSLASGGWFVCFLADCSAVDEFISLPVDGQHG